VTSAANSANLLTNPALDPTSRMPEFKVAAVRIAEVRAPEVDVLANGKPEAPAPADDSTRPTTLPDRQDDSEPSQ
jgi:hypothetical protein